MDRLKLYSLCLAALGALQGCGAGDDSSDTETATEVDVSTGTALNVGVLALDSIDAEAMGVGDSGSLFLLDEESETVSDRDANCSIYGSPMDASGNRLEAGDEGFAETSIYCAVAFNTGSPDSVLGAIGIPGILTCELERAGAWDSDDDFTEDGNEVGDVTITLSTECAEEWIVERLSDGSDGVYPLQDVTLTALPSDHGYDKKISLNMGDEVEEFYIRASDDHIAAKADNWAFAVDLVNNVVLYETLGESTDEDNDTSYVRRIRLRVEGEIGTTGAFTSIDSVSAVKLEGRAVDDGWSSFVTLTGSPATGLASSLYYEDPNDGFTSDETGCSISDCSSLERITATETQIDTFHSDAQIDYLSHLENTGIIDFTKVDLSKNVTYDSNR